ncbi:hypothetical protein GJAV_G00216210 [Gymnothorax javanicus]|nr:hypothetical protein GJAV_G00216210 [Gymnothorax javanicus]
MVFVLPRIYNLLPLDFVYTSVPARSGRNCALLFHGGYGSRLICFVRICDLARLIYCLELPLFALLAQ